VISIRYLFFSVSCRCGESYGQASGNHPFACGSSVNSRPKDASWCKTLQLGKCNFELPAGLGQNWRHIWPLKWRRS